MLKKRETRDGREKVKENHCNLSFIFVCVKEQGKK